jgi:D-3-phosphoglycerate dehydrogenase / 2-oxoglutarate reductase
MESKKVFIADPISKEALGILKEEPSIAVDARPGLPLPEKLAAVKDASGLIVRSETKVDEAFLGACDRLEIVVRAGVGVDNIDLVAATRKGIIVQNIPEGNVRSAAEHSIALLLALSRNLPQGHAGMKAGKWERSKLVGVEVQGKTLAVVGLGKIGRHVVRMALGLGMKVVGHDPFVAPGVAEELGIELLGNLADAAARADFLTLHVPVTKETRGMIGTEVLERAKPGIRIVNCARGGIVDEAALIAALDKGTVAGAAFDVFEKEPPGLTPLVEHPKVIVTPHLGASTREAQENVAIGAAAQMVDYFRSGKLTNPVNAVSIPPEVQEGFLAYRELIFRLGLLQAQLLEGNPSRVTIRFYGGIFEPKIRTYLTSMALCGFLKNRSSQPINAINAFHLAKEMGLAVEESLEGRSRYFNNMIKIRVEDSVGGREIAGTIRGQKGLRVVLLDDYQFDAVLEGRMLIAANRDRPGMIGVIGSILGSHKINVSYMSLGRDRTGGTAIALINLDGEVPAGVLKDLREHEGILWAKVVELPDEPPPQGKGATAPGE